MHCMFIVVLVCYNATCPSLYILAILSSSRPSLWCIFFPCFHFKCCEILLSLQYLTGIICTLEELCQPFYSPFYPDKNWLQHIRKLSGHFKRTLENRCLLGGGAGPQLELHSGILFCFVFSSRLKYRGSLLKMLLQCSEFLQFIVAYFSLRFHWFFMERKQMINLYCSQMWGMGEK